MCMCIHMCPHPSGPLKHFSVQHSQLLSLHDVLWVFDSTGVIDENAEQDHRSQEEKVQRRVEVEKEEGESSDQHRGDLTRQNVEHVVSELQDEGH